MSNPQQTRWHTFDNEPDFVRAARDFILDAAGRAIAARGTFLVVLAGGDTPRTIYHQLRAASTDWSAWHVYFGDERCTAAHDPMRNSRMAAEEWLDHVPIPQNQIHPIPAEQGPQAAARAYAATLANIGRFDLVLLGLGEDGHTASLFPGVERAVGTPPATVIPIFHAPKPPPLRVSLTAQRLSLAAQVAFLVRSEDKRAAIENWRSGASLPAAEIRPSSGVDVFLRV
jgi:6-phosphogluconolactonase